MPAASLRAAAAALAFLTLIPAGRLVRLEPDDVGRGALFFPAAGAGVGALSGLVAAALEGPLPPLLAGGLGIGLALALTGALHLDALADTADALGARTRAEALEVMRDPRIGSFGAAGIAVAVLVEAAALGSLAAAGDAVAGFAAAGALSRAASPPLALTLPYARPQGGTGRVLSGRVSRLGSAGAAASAIGLAFVLLGWDGLLAAGAVGVVVAACGLGCRRWLGGVTGDTLGAAIQLTEIAVLVLLVGLR